MLGCAGAWAWSGLRLRLEWHRHRCHLQLPMHAACAPGCAALPACLSPCHLHCPPQHLVLVRHGESEYNRADAESRSTRDPALFDAKLTTKGKKQAGELRDSLAAVLAKYNTGEGGR